MQRRRLWGVRSGEATGILVWCGKYSVVRILQAEFFFLNGFLLYSHELVLSQLVEIRCA